MPRSHIIRLGVAVAASAAVLGGAAGAAGAASASGTGAATAGNSGSSAVPATLDGIRAKAHTDITDRVDDLNAAIAKVNAAKGLGSGRATLVVYLGTDIAPLQQLDQKIQGDTTVKQAAQDFSVIFTGYRVHVLVLPAARIAGDADRATSTAIPDLTAVSARAQQHVNPRNQESLEPLINDLNAQIATATGATNGLAATVLAFTPAQWNANNDLLSQAKSSDQTTDSALQKGRTDVQDIRQVLRGATTSGAGAAGSGSARQAHPGTTTTA